MTNVRPTDTEIAIIGGGPVGLGLAIDLARRGIRSTILERTTDIHSIPKGQNLTQRTGEHFRAWGVSDAVRTASPIPRDFGNAGLVTYKTLLGPYSYDWFQRAKVAAYYFAKNERLPQYNLERVLRDRVQELAETRLITGAKVSEIAEGNDQVTIHFEQDGETQHLTAVYAVGCDGARSMTRAAAGIPQATDLKGPRMALLVFRSMELDRLLARFPGKSIYNVMNPALDGYWQFLGRFDMDGGWFYHVPVPDDATPETYDFKAHLHRMVGQDFALHFEHIGFWDLRISHAETYRKSRILIAGDAAHSHPPYGGYGVNTGLEDARNLSWKLAASLQGWAGAELLDSYSTERHAVFASVSRDFIERMISDFRDFMAAHSPDRDQAAFEAAWQARAEADDSDVTQFLPHYAGSPIVWGDAGAVSGAKGIHGFKARAGLHLAPQPMARGGDLWDALGPGFTLLDLSGGNGDAFREAAHELGVPLKVIAEENPAMQAAYDATFILIRPDQFIAWASDTAPADATRILARAVGINT